MPLTAWPVMRQKENKKEYMITFKELGGETG